MEATNSIMDLLIDILSTTITYYIQSIGEVKAGKNRPGLAIYQKMI